MADVAAPRPGMVSSVSVNAQVFQCVVEADVRRIGPRKRVSRGEGRTAGGCVKHPAPGSAFASCRLVGPRPSGRFGVSEPRNSEYSTKAGERAKSKR